MYSKDITNTQYLKKGSITNFGIVDLIHDNASFRTTDGFSHNVNETKIFKFNKGIDCHLLSVDVMQMYESIITTKVWIYHVKEKFLVAYYHGEDITDMVDTYEINKLLACF